MVLTQGPGRPGCLQTHPPRTGRPQKPLAHTPRLEGKEGSIWVFPEPPSRRQRWAGGCSGFGSFGPSHSQASEEGPQF